jgi:hypothetical protein
MRTLWLVPSPSGYQSIRLYINRYHMCTDTLHSKQAIKRLGMPILLPLQYFKEAVFAAIANLCFAIRAHLHLSGMII